MKDKSKKFLHIIIKILAVILLLIGILLISFFGIYNAFGTGLVIIGAFIMIFVRPNDDENEDVEEREE